MSKRLAIVLVALVLSMSTVGIQSAYAAPTPTLNQTITAGTLSTDILNSSLTPVASPSATLSSKGFSFDCQTGGSASTGLLGTDAEREYVINPGGANNGWTLAIAPTAGSTAVWTNGSATYDFNDAGGSGCTDSADASDAVGGQLTVNPSAGTLATDCASCTPANITKGSSAAFLEGSVSSVTLLTATAASEDYWRGYLTGSTLSQTIPAQQPAGAYSLPMTITVTAS
jgi:hypothetical protein